MERSDGLIIPEIGRVQHLCAKLMEIVVDGKPGISSHELVWLKQTEENYRLRYKSICLIEKGQPVPKHIQRKLEEQGISKSHMGKVETFVGMELLQAIGATYDFISTVEPKAMRDRERMTSDECARLGAKANIEFLDFFIKVHQKLGLTDQEVIDLFNQIFNRQMLGEESAAFGLEHFPRGLLAELGGYLFLKNKNCKHQYRVPDIELDLNHSVDLIGDVAEDQVNYYEIKTAVPDPVMRLVDLSKGDEVENLKKHIDTLPNSKEKSRRFHSLDKLIDYYSQELKKGREVNAFWLEVPVI